jgi:hypothetical protein
MIKLSAVVLSVRREKAFPQAVFGRNRVVPARDTQGLFERHRHLFE